MRINIYTGEGVLQRNRTSPGGTVLDYIQLITDPTTDADAATKSYVDLKFDNLNVNTITTGALNASVLPAMTGDVISTEGTGVLNLTPVVNAGVYTNVVVNAKGLVTGNTPLQAADIPDMTWSVFTSEIPTTPAGYGIQDAISSAGGVINVNITLSGAPTLADHAATKAYTDTAAATGGGGGVAVGDVMLKMVNTTPAGFLKCNGAMVSKTTFANLYAVMIDALDNRTIIGSGKPWQQQYQINTDGDIGFTNSVAGTTLSTTTAMGEVVVTKNKVFIFGGTNGVNISTIQSAAIAEDGTIGAWSNLPLTLPSGMRNFQVAVTKNFLYVLSGVGAGNSTNFIYRSPIDGNGNLGAWQTDGVLPAGLSGHQVFLTASRMYLIGGSIDGGTTALNTVHMAVIGADGSLGSWTAGPVLPVNVQYTRLSVTKGRVYLMGGHTGSVVIPNLIYGVIDTNGVITSWIASSVLPISTALGHTFTTGEFVYYLGGSINNDLSGVSTNIFRAPVEVDGGIGAWIQMTGTCPVRSGHLISVRNRVHIFGGVNSAGTLLNTSLSYITTNPGAPNDMSFYYTDVIFSPGAAADFKLPDLSFTTTPHGEFYVKF